MKETSSKPYESFDFELEARTLKVIPISIKKRNFLRIYGKITSQSVFGAPKLLIHLVREVDKPPETLASDRQRDVLRQKAFYKKKVAADFQFEYTSMDTESILLVFDNNHPVATRSANVTIQILEKKEEETKPPDPVVVKPEVEIPDKIFKRILGVLKSFQTVSMKELTSYSGLDINETRNIVFELIAEDQVTGRFDSKSDSFISASAASASREIRSDQQSLARCVYCGNPLEKALMSGDEVKCPSCGIINVG